MAEDEVLKRYLSNDIRYADLINGVSFGGRQVVRAEDLSDRDTQTGYHKNTGTVKGKRNTKYRDLFRKVSFGANFAVVGIENQAQVHYLMPLRCMEYDLKEYQRQETEQKNVSRQNKENGKAGSGAEFLSGVSGKYRLQPCITIVLYYGDEWDGSADLHGLLDFTNIPEELHRMVNNYELNLVDIKRMEDTGRFHSDLKQVFDFIRCSRNKQKMKELITTDSAYQNLPEDAYDVIAEFTKSRELVQLREKQEGENIDMCKALQDWAAEERSEGRKEGRQAGISALVNSLKFFIQDEEKLYQAVIKNEVYKNISREEIRSYL